jgi:undecaprenyl-diphosphatase
VLPLLSGGWRQGAVTFAVVAVLVIGFSRIALGVHYVSEVAGGYFLGAAWVAAMAIAFDVMAVNRTASQADNGRSTGGQTLGGTSGG